jgi:hypothetical protein
MSTIVSIFQDTAFDQSAINAMDFAFEDLLLDLNLTRGDPRAEIIARKVIECARAGERDPDRLNAMTLKSLGS